MGTIIRNNVVYGSSSNIIELSMADYEAREAAGGIDSDVMYFIPDAEEYANVSANTNISDFFSISTDYTSGDCCIYNNQLYEFIEDKPAGSWDESKVTITTIKNKLEEIESISKNITTSESCVRFNEATGYVEIYYNGQWNNWLNSNITEDEAYNQYLYYKGTNYSDICGAWEPYDYISSTSTGTRKTPTVTMNSSYMTFKISATASAGYTGSIWSQYAIDLTDYNYIEINYKTSLVDGAGSFSFACVPTKGNKYTRSSDAISLKSSSNANATLDISSLTGSHYLVFSIYYCSSNIYSIKLIK